jgi:predicted nucleic acid-binding protein
MIRVTFPASLQSGRPRPRAACSVKTRALPTLPISLDTHKTALAIAEKYGYGIYDALVAAAALEAGCKTLYSEDLRNEQRINCRLTIRNPFR